MVIWKIISQLPNLRSLFETHKKISEIFNSNIYVLFNLHAFQR